MNNSLFQRKNLGWKLICTSLCFLMIMSMISPALGSTLSKESTPVTTKDSLSTFYKKDDHITDAVKVNIDHESEDTLVLTYSINWFEKDMVTIDDQIYTSISLPEESNIKYSGMPDLPNIRRSIIIPDNQAMRARILEVETKTMENVYITPSKGILPRTINPEEVPYRFDRIYDMDTLFPKQLIELSDPYILRDYRGMVVTLNPFQYNPGQKSLEMYTSVTVELFTDGIDDHNVIIRESAPEQVDASFQPVYKNHFFNYGSTTRYTPVSEQGNMLVITYDQFWDEMTPFVEWKNKKGIPTEMVNVSSIGSATQIKAFIQNYYDTQGITYVLLVGDIAQIPSLEYSYHAADPKYAMLAGGDNYQDIFVGRFSANNENELITQVERSIMYEQNPELLGTWYAKGSGIGSDEGTGDDGEYDWEHMRNIRSDLLGFTYTHVDEFYGGSQGGEDAPGNPSSADITAAINEGRGFINYVGHGAWDGWGWGSVSGWYVLHNSDISNLVNDNMLPFVISVACNSGEFESYNACFAELWMRATNNGQPTGAIGVFASTQSQSWDPPMDAQDEITDLLVSEAKITFGGLCYSGTMHMMDEYGSSCYDETNTWTVFGDPSLQVRTMQPTTLTVEHASTIMDGAETFDVQVPDVEGALVAISSENQLLGYGYTEVTGQITISFDPPLADYTELDLVVTSFNAEPYMVTLDVVSKRQPAEFDPMQGTLIRYPFGLSYTVIAELAEEDELVTIVTGPSQEQTVRSIYSSHGVNMDHCSFLHAPSDSYWTRDYGPWFVFDVNGDQRVVDFDYNRPRPNDNAIPAAFANWKGLPLDQLGLTHTGGNYMTDGRGIAVSTDLVDGENPGISIGEIQDIAADILGITQYHIIPDALGEYIEHIDCWAKLLSPDTLMIIEVPPGHSQYDELETAVDYFEGQLSSWGTPYDIIRLYAPNGEPYVNSLILNDKVLVPITGSSQWDDDAISTYQTAMPGYEILGFTGTWQTTDALHCRTKGIPDPDMIFIDHLPLTNNYPDVNGFLVEALIQDYSDTGFVPGSVELHWKVDPGDWESVDMNELGNEQFRAYIPPVAADETVYYYLQASNNAGVTVAQPIMGNADPHSFIVTPVPDIWISPEEFQINAPTQSITTELLIIGNDELAGNTLTFDISSSDQSGYGWLSVSPTIGSLDPAESQDIQLTIDTNSVPPGSYEEIITISSNDPDEPLLNVPVELSVTYGDDTGVSMIINPTGTVPGGPITIEARVENYGSEQQSEVPVYCEVMEGIFTTFVDEDFMGSVPPSEWSQEETGEWQQYTGNEAGGSSPEARLHWSDIEGDYAYLQTSESNTFGAPTLTLEFNHYIDHYSYGGGDYSCRVLTRSSSGDIWTDVTPWSNPINTDVGPATETIDISSAIGPGTQVRFEFDGYYWDIDNWHIDNVVITSQRSRDPGDIVYSSNLMVDLDAYQTMDVTFDPTWVAEPAVYGINVWTDLPGDEQPSNDQLITVVTIDEPLEFILNLADFPMYQALSTPSYQEMSGPACAQMTLDYIWWNQTQQPDGPPELYDQTWLYERGLENNTDPDLTYLDTTGLWNIIQYNKPMPYTEYGYNFMKYNNEDVDEVLKRICLFINYTIGTYGGYKPGHPTHVPALVPAYGDYSNWMAIRGIHTDREAYPLQEDLTVYGFWVNDPVPGGLGENSYKTLNQWLDLYYQPITSNDQYNGKYVTILEPPEADYSHDLHRAEQTTRFTRTQQYILDSINNKKMPITVQLESQAKEWVKQAATQGAIEELATIDEEFAELFTQLTADQPFYVQASRSNDYYLIPFSSSKGVQCVIIIDAANGKFLEATWTQEPIDYLPVSQQDALSMVKQLVQRHQRRQVSDQEFDCSLLYSDDSPYYPVWHVKIESMGIEIHINQQGEFIS